MNSVWTFETVQNLDRRLVGIFSSEKLAYKAARKFLEEKYQLDMDMSDKAFVGCHNAHIENSRQQVFYSIVSITHVQLDRESLLPKN